MKYVFCVSNPIPITEYLLWDYVIKEQTSLTLQFLCTHTVHILQFNLFDFVQVPLQTGQIIFFINQIISQHYFLFLTKVF